MSTDDRMSKTATNLLPLDISDLDICVHPSHVLSHVRNKKKKKTTPTILDTPHCRSARITSIGDHPALTRLERMLLPTTPAVCSPVELADGRFRAYNVDSTFDHPDNVQEYFSLAAQPNSKVSRRPPEQDEVSSPMLLTKLTSPFILAEVTVSADFEMDWDQGGLIIFAGSAPGQHSPSLSQMYRRRHMHGETMHRTVSQQRGKWAKVGLEFTGGELGVSTVVANPDCGADWSFTPAFPSLTPREAFSMAMPSLRVKLERVGGDLWVWYRIPDELPAALTARTPGVMSRNWKKCREIAGFFDGMTTKTGIWVGCYASRPMDLEDPCEDDNLFVEFEDLEIM